MKKNIIRLIVFSLIFVFFVEIQISAKPTDIDDIKKFEFDSPRGISNHYSSVTGNIATFIVYFLLFVGVAVLVYVTTRWIGKHKMKMIVRSKYMEVVDSLSLGSEKGLYIIKSPQGFMVLGVTKESIYLLEKLGEEETELIKQAEANEEGYDKGFAGYLSQYLSKIKGTTNQTKHGGSK